MFKAKDIYKNYAFSIFWPYDDEKKNSSKWIGWMEARWMGFSFGLNTHHSWYLPWHQKQALFLTWKRASDPRPPTVGHHFFETMCPTAFLAPTLIAKTCFICTQPKHAFFLAQLALQHCRPQCHIRMAAEIDIAIFEWQTRRRHPKTASETSRV